MQGSLAEPQWVRIPKHVFPSSNLTSSGTYRTRKGKPHCEDQRLRPSKGRMPEHDFVMDSSTNPAMFKTQKSFPARGNTLECLVQGLSYTCCSVMDSREASRARAAAGAPAKAKGPSMSAPVNFDKWGNVQVLRGELPCDRRGLSMLHHGPIYKSYYTQKACERSHAKRQTWACLPQGEFYKSWSVQGCRKIIHAKLKAGACS